MPYIEEVCVAGNTIEISKYYTYRTHTKGEKRQPKDNPTCEAQKRVNQRRAERDLRRLMEKAGNDAFTTKIEDAMTRNPKTINPESLAAEAVRIMEAGEISVLIAVEGGKPVGIIHIHELLKAGIA